MGALTPDLHQVEIAVVEMTNAARRENKLAAVKINPKLSKAARAYASLLAQNQAFSHTYAGSTVPQRIAAAGYKFCTYSENLAMEARSQGFFAEALASSAVNGWLNSPSHRANLLGRTIDRPRNLAKPRFTITHSSCSTGNLSFQQDGGLFTAPVKANFTAQDGTAYRLSTNDDGKLSVSVSKSEN